ncbi:phospholipid-transporting ATPase VD isoform X1 [Onthophagus taurus]|uniref:phospholipid-transporting ATPase VD isoform X1 n=1 Tax=Onthophagus taurus TaxID=166361 RepID=UPI0039BDBAF4
MSGLSGNNGASRAESSVHCSTYTFPQEIRDVKGHGRSASHGGGASLAGSSSANIVAGRPSALKTTRGHQRAFSQGQIPDSSVRPGHSRVGSKTDFILPPGHKETETGGPVTTRSSLKGHSRQASRSESIYTLRRSAPPSMWRRLMCLVLRRSPRYEQEERFRIIVPNHTVPPKTPNKDHPNGKRPNNKIRTTKYTLLSFLPRNLLEQFHRVANLYFIFIVLLNWFPAINAFGKEIAMIPVLFVLGVTAVKDLFEDRRRYASDKRINNSTCRIYHSEADRYKKVLWKDVRVGDLIHLSNNEVVPADILLLRSSDPNGLCYIDTGHLDGETNLKQRQVARGFVEKQHRFQPNLFKSKIEVEPPTTKIYRFHGAIIHETAERIPVGTENLLLRECLLKNTDYVEGIVVYAGHETKAMLNNGGPRYKRSSLEKQMNQDVIWCVLTLIILCVIGAIGCKVWLVAAENMGEPFISDTFSSSGEAFLAFWTYVIILQILIPLSLYVTLEMCKIIQVYHIHNNVDLYDPVTNKRTQCRALNITEELGQIQYIFSDKTGTLTENRMIFRHCSIAGVDYEHPQLVDELEANGGLNKLTSLSVVCNPKLIEDLSSASSLHEHVLTPKQIHASRAQEFLIMLAVCNTVVCSHHPHVDMMNESGTIEQQQIETNFDDNSNNDRYRRLAESRSVTPSPPLTSTSNVYLGGDRRQHVPSLTPISDTSPTTTELNPDLTTKMSIIKPKRMIPTLFLSKRNGTNLTDEQKLKMNLSSTPSPKDSKPIYEAESPDELALVDTAYNYEFKLKKRSPGLLTVQIPGDGRLEFEILAVLPFDSVRKCMSVIVKHPITKRIILYCKGADSTILTRMAPIEDDSEQKHIITRTQQHLNSYARKGLRVLVMAKRVLTLQEYNDWSRKHQEAELAHDNVERKLRDVYGLIESNLTVIGATAIEDRLQEGVPETLTNLISAGIIIWVLTGDKPETAINIAYSAKLFSPNMEVLKIMARSKEAAENSILLFLSEIEREQGGETDENYPEASVRSRRSMQGQARALVVDGKTLTFILDRRSNLTTPFLKLSTYCSSVLCCRATPLQKAYIVKVVKEELKMRTLAIGDGANDVSMIQTADVGIGISGQEGMQAVMASDFALPRFKFLERFLLVHGHWCYDRLSNMILYFFYKNAAFVFLIFWFQLFCGFSGTVMIDQMYLMLYNLLFTSLPPIAIGVYDQNAPEELLINEPYLYRRGRLGRAYKSHSFWLTLFDALYQSIAVFFICFCVYYDTDIGLFEFGTVLTTACMFVMLLHAGIEIRSWTIIHVLTIVFSISVFYIYSYLYNSICVSCFGLPSSYGVIQNTASTLNYWLVIPICCVTAILPRIIIRVAKNIFYPEEVTKAVIEHRRAARRGEGFLVSWSRSTSASSIYRTANNRSQDNIVTVTG